jgi:hypothetical protein
MELSSTAFYYRQAIKKALTYSEMGAIAESLVSELERQMNYNSANGIPLDPMYVMEAEAVAKGLRQICALPRHQEPPPRACPPTLASIHALDEMPAAPSDRKHQIA